MNAKNWLRACVFLTVPSLALSAASLVVIGGVLSETKAEVVAERERIDKLSEMMIATSRMMRTSQEDRNNELALRVSNAAQTISARVGNAETNVDNLVQRINRVEANAASRRH